MMRWLLRLSIGALLAALLFWLWNRLNQDLAEEEEFDEEIPFEFDVPLEDGAPILTGASSPGDDIADRLATSVGTLTTMPAEVATDGATASTAAATNGMTPTSAAASADGSPAATTADAESGDQAEVSPTPPAKGAQEGWNPHEHEEETGDAPPPGAGDNLITIKGVGPVYGARLAEMGITTYGALIAAPVDILTAAFPRVSEAEIENWITQARELADQEG